MGTNLGPLTTISTLPSQCYEENIAIAQNSDVDITYQLTIGPGQSSCYSSSTFPFISSYYSPGLCPSGYTWACSDRNTYSFGAITETTVTCCPSSPYSMACNTDTVESNWGVIALAGCTTTRSSVTISEALTSGLASSAFSAASLDPDTGNEILFGPIVNAYGIQVRWQPSDEAVLFPGASTAGTTTSDGGGGPASTSDPSSTPTADGPGDADGGGGGSISSGAIAGIAVGAAVAVVALLAAVAWIMWTKRRQRKQHRQSQMGEAGPGAGAGMGGDLPRNDSREQVTAASDPLMRHEMSSQSAASPRSELAAPMMQQQHQGNVMEYYHPEGPKPPPPRGEGHQGHVFELQ
ncbi:hypothetical protein F4780DRAFT_774175 [Xylariomycetidae sp. FL0641]|nr:hypothetical protein F4780DRAFT_774175 [Xylariomycetidae sp. FL0641]